MPPGRGNSRSRGTTGAPAEGVDGKTKNAEGAQSDVSLQEPPSGRSIVRHSDSDLGDDEMDAAGVKGDVSADGKRAKLGTPPRVRLSRLDGVKPASPKMSEGRRKKAAKGSGSGVGSGTDSMATTSGVEGGFVGGRRITGGSDARSAIVQLKSVTESLLGVVCGAGLEGVLVRDIMEYAGQYEQVVMMLVAENERLRGRLDMHRVIGGSPNATFEVPKVSPSGSQATVAPVPPLVKKPVETWSLVVKSKNATAGPKEVASKVVEQVGPALTGVRVHEVKSTRDGRAVIRTPSVAERDRIAGNPKFGEVGLDVEVNDRLGAEVNVRGVHSEITPDEFMSDLYELNLKEVMSPAAFKKGVRIASRPWKSGDGEITVVLEGCSTAIDTLLGVGRCYIKWFGFRVFSRDPVLSCHRCKGFDHVIKECRFKEGVCYRCGQVGHVAHRCVNNPHCRNCALKGLPSAHLMTSVACPVYGGLVARAKARH